VRTTHTATRRRRRLTHLALPAAGLLTLVGASVAVVVTNTAAPVEGAAPAERGDGDLIAAALQDGGQRVSRSAERAPLPNEAAAEEMVKGHKYVIESDAADVYADADDTSPVLAVLAPGQKVDVTGKKQKAWTEIVHKARPRWVKSDSLTKQEPLGQKPCKEGSGVEGGLQPDTIRVYRAVCAKFPSVSSYGGTRGGGGDHGTGRALDIMVGGNSRLGDQIAAFLQENRAELGIEYIIWQQRIWRPSTSNSWRGMSDRGSPTANHMDHPHVNTYGNSGTS
jgi:hypothetical protein